MICHMHKFREKLKTGRLCLGPGVSFTDPSVTEALCESVDFLWLDLEHTPIGLESVQNHLIAARAGGAPILVRVPSSEIAWTKRVLDIGAEGVILPQAKSVAEVEAFVAACRYPPLGRRGFGPRRPSNYGRISLAEYLKSANDGVFAAVQIETVELLEALDAVVQIRGIDSLVVGPSDLAGALVGKPGDIGNPKVLEAIGTICTKARKAGLSVGLGMGPDEEYALKVAALGVQWIQYGGDCGFMLHGTETAYRKIRGRIAESGRA
jgi:2-keto-3-deoxy-L-rhamnonate aldolase RhmA